MIRLFDSMELFLRESIFQPKLKKRAFHYILSMTLPRNYREEAIELIKADSRTNRSAVLTDYFVGGINYRLRKLWMRFVSFLYHLLETFLADMVVIDEVVGTTVLSKQRR